MTYIKLGFFKIKQVKESLNYKLALLKTINIFLVFYISLLEKAPIRISPASVIEIELLNPNAKYKVERILNCKIISGKIKYFIK